MEGVKMYLGTNGVWGRGGIVPGLIQQEMGFL